MGAHEGSGLRRHSTGFNREVEKAQNCSLKFSGLRQHSTVEIISRNNTVAEGGMAICGLIGGGSKAMCVSGPLET